VDDRIGVVNRSVIIGASGYTNEVGSGSSLAIDRVNYHRHKHIHLHFNSSNLLHTLVLIDSSTVGCASSDLKLKSTRIK
jgi:hypothetical protein